MIKESIIRHENGKWVVKTHDGSRVLGTHDTREDAEKQLYAIEINKKKSFNSRTASDISFELLGPCTGDKNCRSCAHFNELLEELKPQASAEGKSKPVSSGDKRQKKLIQDMMGRHQKARVGSKTAVVTHQSKLDFDRWMPSGWQMLHHGEPEDPLSYPGAMWHDQGVHHDDLHSPDYKNLWNHMYPGGEDELSHHHIVVLHHPETNNRVKLYDHSESMLNPGKALRTDMYWNIDHYGPHIHDLMHTLNEGTRDTTLDLTHNVRKPSGELITGRHGSFTSPWSGFHGNAGGFIDPQVKNTVYITDPLTTGATTLEQAKSNLQELPNGYKDIWSRTLVNGNASGSIGTLHHELGHLHRRSIESGQQQTSRDMLELMRQAMSGGNALHKSNTTSRHVAGYLHRLINNGDIQAKKVLNTMQYNSHNNAPPPSFSNYGILNHIVPTMEGLARDHTLENVPPLKVHGAPKYEHIHPPHDDRGVKAIAIMTTSPSTYGVTNLDENYAEHYRAWMEGQGYNRFTQALAHHFKWSNPHKISTIEDVRTVFDAPCPCCDENSGIAEWENPIWSTREQHKTNG